MELLLTQTGVKVALVVPLSLEDILTAFACGTGSTSCSIEASFRSDSLHHDIGAGEHAPEAGELGLARGAHSLRLPRHFFVWCPMFH